MDLKGPHQIFKDSMEGESRVVMPGEPVGDNIDAFQPGFRSHAFILDRNTHMSHFVGIAP